MPIFFNNASHDIAFGRLPIEKMGGNVITYSMYGENIPVVLEDGEYILKVKCVENNSWYLTNKGNLYGCGDNSTGQ
nr:MAG TPA: E3 ubiquitin-protein ligase [Caudoviricetes sp.]